MNLVNSDGAQLLTRPTTSYLSCFYGSIIQLPCKSEGIQRGHYSQEVFDDLRYSSTVPMGGSYGGVARPRDSLVSARAGLGRFWQVEGAMRPVLHKTCLVTTPE